LLYVSPVKTKFYTTDARQQEREQQQRAEQRHEAKQCYNDQRNSE